MEALRSWLEFYAGVLTLLALSGAVMWGLIAVLLPSIRGRIIAQAVHRAFGVIAVGCVVAHVLLSVAHGQEGRSHLLHLLGYGAAGGMLAVYVTGAARRWFLHGAGPQVWRVVHATSYLAWPVAVGHGLLNGRHPKAWVTASYVICLVAVGGALLVRLGRGGRAPARARVRGHAAGARRGQVPVGRHRGGTS